jgi:hypothetical protein
VYILSSKSQKEVAGKQKNVSSAGPESVYVLMGNLCHNHRANCNMAKQQDHNLNSDLKTLNIILNVHHVKFVILETEISVTNT